MSVTREHSSNGSRTLCLRRGESSEHWRPWEGRSRYILDSTAKLNCQGRRWVHHRETETETSLAQHERWDKSSNPRWKIVGEIGFSCHQFFFFQGLLSAPCPEPDSANLTIAQFSLSICYKQDLRIELVINTFYKYYFLKLENTEFCPP